MSAPAKLSGAATTTNRTDSQEIHTVKKPPILNPMNRTAIQIFHATVARI